MTSEPGSERGRGDDPIADNLSGEDVLRLWRNGDLRTAELGLIPPGMKESWRSVAVGHLMRLDLADGIEAKALRELCMALRDGLTPEQQRTVAQDLLGEPHVSMIMARAGQLVSVGVKVLVPARRARSLVGGAGGHLYPDETDPWWDK